jgi:hypothetical protein
MENIGIGNSNWDLDYSIEKFVNGKTLFAFDLNPGKYKFIFLINIKKILV